MERVSTRSFPQYAKESRNSFVRYTDEDGNKFVAVTAGFVLRRNEDGEFSCSALVVRRPASSLEDAPRVLRLDRAGTSTAIVACSEMGYNLAEVPFIKSGRGKHFAQVERFDNWMAYESQL
jgi:hypothetical protein